MTGSGVPAGCQTDRGEEAKTGQSGGRRVFVKRNLQFRNGGIELIFWQGGSREVWLRR